MLQAQIMLYVPLTFLLLGVVGAKLLPPDIKRCGKSDPNFNDCMSEATVEAVVKLSGGNDDLGLSTLEPFFIKKVDLGNSTSGAVTLSQVYENMKLFNMTNAKVLETDANFKGDNCYWNYKTLTPFVQMEADYTMKGQVLLFPINGHGKCKHLLYNVTADCKGKCERIDKKGKTYLKMTQFSMKMVPEKIVFGFENIIDGNEQLSKQLLATLNEHSKAVYAEVAASFDQVMSVVWMQTFNQVFSRVPEDDLFLP